MQDYIHPDWQPTLKKQGLNHFDALWTLDADWFEPPNLRRGGWSGVSRIEIIVPGRGSIGLFLKRQENHCSKTWQHPFSGIATLEKEFHNILQFHKHKIPTVDPIYFAKRTVQGKVQAILITEELSGYQPLASLATSEVTQAPLSRQQLLQKVADVIQTMHAHHFQHNCLYLKHLFAKQKNGCWSVKIIDLEKTKYRVSKKQVLLRDLGTLHRRTAAHWTNSDRIILLRAYMGEEKLSNHSKKIAQKIAKTVTIKNNRTKARQHV